MKHPRYITEVIEYWLNFESLCKRHCLFSESYMVYPIGQYLREMYGDKISAEYPHPILKTVKTGVGDKPRIDFVVLGDKINKEDERPIEFALENKWCSENATTIENIIKDIIRLELIAYNYNASCYFILAGKNKHLKILFKNKKFTGNDNTDVLLSLTENSSTILKLNPAPSLRNTTIKNALEPFSNLDIANSIKITSLRKYISENSEDEKVSVYGWRIKKRKHIKRFKPEDVFYYSK